MPSVEKPKAKTYDELLSEVPAEAREEIARARNHRARMMEGRDQMLTESTLLQASVRRLRYRHDLNKTRIGALLGLSRKRIDQILEKSGV